jgi:pyruvate-formate lyase
LAQEQDRELQALKEQELKDSLQLKEGFKEMIRTEGWEYLKNVYFKDELSNMVTTLNQATDTVVIYRTQGAMNFYIEMVSLIEKKMKVMEEKDVK